MKRNLACCALLLFAQSVIAAPVDESAEHPGWEKSGDLLQFGVPLIGLGLTFLLRSANGSDDRQFTFDFTSLTAAEVGDPAATGLNWPGPRLGKSPQNDFFVSFLRMWDPLESTCRHASLSIL